MEGQALMAPTLASHKHLGGTCLHPEDAGKSQNLKASHPINKISVSLDLLSLEQKAINLPRHEEQLAIAPIVVRGTNAWVNSPTRKGPCKLQTRMDCSFIIYENLVRPLSSELLTIFPVTRQRLILKPTATT